MSRTTPILFTLATCLLLAACAGSSHGLVERDGRPCHHPDVPVPPGYVLLSSVQGKRLPRHLTYESPAETALSEDALVAYFTAELPEHGWTEVTFDATKGVISAKKPTAGQAPEKSVYVSTRIEASASDETRATMEVMGMGSPESHAARSFMISR